MKYVKLSELKREIKGVFKPPKKRYYLGKLTHGTPYFYPRNFNPTIIYIRKLKLKSEEELQKHREKSPHLEQYREKDFKFSNVPMVRRSKNWIIEIFKNSYYIELDWPVAVLTTELGWKDKFESPRFEWSPQFTICFFNWQFCIWWNAPDENNDKYYEMILWYLKYCNKDIDKAKKDWGWIDCDTKLSTWNKDYLI